MPHRIRRFAVSPRAGVAIAVALAAAGVVTAALSLGMPASANASGAILMPEDVANLDEVSDPRVSPDGRFVVYTQKIARAPDEERGKSYSMIWIVPAAGGEPVAYTARDGRASNPQWSPDGRFVAFLDKRGAGGASKGDDAKSQIFVMPVDGGEARAVTKEDEGVSEFAWGASASVMFYTAKDAKTKEKKEAERLGRDWEVAGRDHRQTRLYRLDVAGGEARALTDTTITVRAIAVSPDGKRVAALAADTPTVDASYMFQRLVNIDAESGSVALVWDMPGKAARPRWSRDGRSIACLAGIDASDSYAGSIFVVPATGGGAINLMPGAASTATWFDWDNAGSIVALSIRGTQTVVERLARDGRVLETISLDGPVSLSADIGSGAGPFVTAASTPLHPAEIFVHPLGDGPWTRLTRSYPALEGIALGRQEVITWQARDGMTIEGILVYPVSYAPGKRYPLVVGVHGGPEVAMLDGWYTDPTYPSQLFASRGAVFLLPNYRGSIGRGVAFTKGDFGDPAGAEFQDVLDGIDALAAQGLVDPERVGIIGRSYGGYMSAWAATKESARFKAAVVNYGVANMWSAWACGDIPSEHELVHWGWFPVDRPLIAFDRSPVSHVRNGRTPTLIMHGASDKRVHPTQSLELYEGLKLQKGLPVEFVMFPREEHGYVEAPHRLEACRRAVDWMTKYLALDAPPAAANARGSKGAGTAERESAHHAH
ncbi:MAG: S9 family peptidase [bacterium]